MADRQANKGDLAKIDAAVDQERMSFGDHLEELRKRIFLAMIGVVVAVVACFFFAQEVVTFLCQPLVLALVKAGQSPHLYQEQVPQLFLNYMSLAILAGVILSSPWIVYHLWKFVGAGLYQKERKFVKVYGVVSLGLFLAGAAFVFFIAMPFALKYFVEFGQSFHLPNPGAMSPVQRLIYGRGPSAPGGPSTQPQPLALPVLDQPPSSKIDGLMWVDRTTEQIQFYSNGQVRTVRASSEALVEPLFNLAEYLKFTISMMFVFGIGFQMPLVILFLAHTGIVQSATMAKQRRVVIMAIVILAAVISPSPDAVSMMLLATPMWGLFELGLLLGRRAERRKAAA